VDGGTLEGTARGILDPGLQPNHVGIVVFVRLVRVLFHKCTCRYAPRIRNSVEHEWITCRERIAGLQISVLGEGDMFTCEVTIGVRREERSSKDVGNLNATSLLKFKLRQGLVYDVNK